MKMMSKDTKTITVAVSGGFDPIHPGHLALIKEAKSLGDKLVVILNNDNWLRSKKGYVVQNQKARKEILLALEEVDEVVITKHMEYDDSSVGRALRQVNPDIFANGGDRTNENTPETRVCESIGTQMVFGVGGEKKDSSQDITKRTNKELGKKS